MDITVSEKYLWFPVDKMCIRDRIYVVVSVVLVNVVAFLLALLVTGKLRGKKFFRAGFFVPNLIGGIVLGYIWQFIFKTILVYIGKNAGIGFLSKDVYKRQI